MTIQQAMQSGQSYSLSTSLTVKQLTGLCCLPLADDN